MGGMRGMFGEISLLNVAGDSISLDQHAWIAIFFFHEVDAS